MKKLRILVSVVMMFMVLNLSIVSAYGATNDNSIYQASKTYKSESGIDLAALFPDVSDETKAYWKKTFGNTIVKSVTETEQYFRLDSTQQLVPMTNKEVNEISPLDVGSGENYGIKVFAVTSERDSNGEILIGGNFEWTKTPPLAQGNSIDGFAISWNGELTILRYNASLRYDEGTEYPSASNINPASGIAIEFSEAIDKGWFSSNWYLQSGGISATIKKGDGSFKNDSGNVTARYLHTSTTTTVTGLGISFSGGSISWTTTEKVEPVAAVAAFKY